MCSLRLIDLKPKIDKKSQTALKILTPNQKPITWSEQLPCAHVTAFSRTSLFLERFWREFWISFKFHKPVSKTYRHKNNYIFCLLITFSFQFGILYFECVHRHGGRFGFCFLQNSVGCNQFGCVCRQHLTDDCGLQDPKPQNKHQILLRQHSSIRFPFQSHFMAAVLHRWDNNKSRNSDSRSSGHYRVQNRSVREASLNISLDSQFVINRYRQIHCYFIKTSL